MALVRTLLLVLSVVLPLAAQSRAEAESRLKARIDKAGTGAAAKISVGVSASGSFLVAEIGSGEGAQVLIERFVPSGESAEKPAGSLRIRPVLRQVAPVLDFEYLDGKLVVLEPSRVVLDGKPLVIPLAAAMPRDPRGRLLIRGENVEVRLPGTTCTIRGGAACKPDESAWREPGIDVAWAPRRNYLLSRDAAGERLYSAVSRAAVTTLPSGVGDDVASIEAGCAVSTLVVSSNGSPDTLHVVQVDAGGARVITDGVSLPGPVTALWTAANPAEVSVVVKNTATGEYEASRVSVDCGR